MSNQLDQRDVYCAWDKNANYGACDPVAAPELPEGVAEHRALVLLRDLLRHAGLHRNGYGTPEWNPLKGLIHEGDKVLIKPNWVFHENHSGQTMDCLLTHSKLIEAILRYVMKAGPASVIVGDAPIQGCDFKALLHSSRFQDVADVINRQGGSLEVRDLRCVIRKGSRHESRIFDSSRREDQYVLFDLGDDSMLEPISNDSRLFRVTMYNPDDLLKTHTKGKHLYLVAREVLEADVVINVPKLKTHNKAGITGALKNMVGINGHKSFLPHHRKGGSLAGGDCYQGKSVFKATAEHVLDLSNRSGTPLLRKGLSYAAIALVRAGRCFGQSRNIAGSWHGNDTVWRMCLDLQRILHYGRLDGTLAETPARKIITLTDAIIAGEGEGPLCPLPVPLGFLTLGSNTAALDWVHAHLMRFDPARIPLVRHAFDGHRFPLANFPPQQISITVNGAPVTPDQLVSQFSRDFLPPEGWRGHCESETPTARRLRNKEGHKTRNGAS